MSPIYIFTAKKANTQFIKMRKPRSNLFHMVFVMMGFAVKSRPTPLRVGIALWMLVCLHFGLIARAQTAPLPAAPILKPPRLMDVVPDFSFTGPKGKLWKSRDALGSNAVLLLLLPDEASNTLGQKTELLLRSLANSSDALHATSIEPVVLLSPQNAEGMQKRLPAAVWQKLVIGQEVEPIRPLFGSAANQVRLIFIDKAGFWRRVDRLNSVEGLATALKQILISSRRIEVGQMAPDFSMPTSDGRVFRLGDLRGQKNLLFTFFPKCFTGGCTNHLSSLRDQQSQFDAAQTEILAVSIDPADGPRGQLAFAARWNFGFSLVPDVGRNLCLLYGATNSPNQLATRMSVLIDKNGIVRWVTRDVNIHTHGADVMAVLEELDMSK